MNFFKKALDLFKNKKFVTWLTVGVCVTVIASTTLGVMLSSYGAWSAYYDAAIADREHRKYLQTLPLECLGITARLNDNVTYYDNGRADPKPEDFTVVARFTEKGVDSEKILFANEFEVSTDDGFAKNAGDITVKYVFRPEAPEPAEGEEPVTPEPQTFTTTVNYRSLETVVPVSIERLGTPYRVLYDGTMPFDGDGMNATVTFNDGSTETVGNDEFTYADNILAVGTRSVDVTWERGGTAFDFTCPVNVVSESEYDDGDILSIASAGTYYIDPGADTANATPSVRATYESGNRLLLPKEKYTVRGNTAKASFTKKCILSVYLTDDSSIFTRLIATVMSGLRAEDATLSNAETAEINESSYVNGELVTSAETSTVIVPRSGSTARFGFSCDALSTPNMSVRLAMKPETAVVADEGETSTEVNSVDISNIMAVIVNGAAVKLPELVLMRNEREKDKYVFSDVKFAAPLLRNGVNDIRLMFRNADADKIVIERINLEAAYGGNFFASTEEYFAYNSRIGATVDYEFSIVKPFGNVAGKAYGHSICSDGTYLYMVGQSGSGNGRSAAVSKYDMKTNQEVAVSASINPADGVSYVSEAFAGITYYDGKIIIYRTDGKMLYVNKSEFANGCTFKEYDGFKFEGLRHGPSIGADGKEIPRTAIKDVYYNVALGRFAVYYDNKLSIYNKDLTLYKEVSGFTTGAKRVSGSIDYIYASYTSNGSYSPRLRLYDWDGNAVGKTEMTVSIPQDFLTANGVTNFSNTNVQGFSVINGDFYVTLLKFNPGDSSAFIKITMPEIDEKLAPELSFSEFVNESLGMGVSPSFTIAPTTDTDVYGTIDGTNGYSMGGASDGRYLYFAVNTNGNAQFKVTKMDASTHRVIATSADNAVAASVANGDNSRMFIKDDRLYVVAGDVYSIALSDFGAGCEIKRDDAMTALLSDGGIRVLKSAGWSAARSKYVVHELDGTVSVLDEFGNTERIVTTKSGGSAVSCVACGDEYFFVGYGAMTMEMFDYNGKSLASNIKFGDISSKINNKGHNLQTIYFHDGELHLSLWIAAENKYHDWTATPDVNKISISTLSDYISACIADGKTPVFKASPSFGSDGSIDGGYYGKGGTSDGRYIYFTRGGNTESIIVKVDPLNNYTAVANSAAHGFGGDLGRLFIKDGKLYCTAGNKVYSIALSDFVGGCTLAEDTEMFDILSAGVADRNIVSAYYNADADKYAVLANNRIYILNGSGTEITSFVSSSAVMPSWVMSSVCGDSEYIYVNNRNDGQQLLPIRVYDWTGKFIREIDVLGATLNHNSFNIQAIYLSGGKLHAIFCTWGGSGSACKDWTIDFDMSVLS